MTGTARKGQFAIVPMWVHRAIVATRTRTIAHAVYVELVGRFAGSEEDADGLRVWPQVQQIADGLGVPKSSVERALAVLIDCGVVLRKRTVRRNQYWLPQEDPAVFAETLAEYQTVTSDGPQTVTSDGPQTVTSDGPQTVTSDGLYNPDPSNPDPSNPPPPEPAASPAPQSDEDFDSFWSAYPRKIGKPDGRKAWKAAMKRGDDPKLIIQRATAQADIWRTNGKTAPDQRQYIPHPATWLNREYYHNEEPDRSGPNTQPPRPARQRTNEERGIF